MAKLTRLTLFLSINLLLTQYSYCKRTKRGITDFFIPGINIGDIALEKLQEYIYGAPVDKDQMILDKQLEHMDLTREILSLTHDIAMSSENAPEMTVLIQTLQNVPKYMNRIDTAFRQYEVYEHSKRNASDYPVYQFATYSNNRYIGPIKEIIDLYSITIPSAARRRTSNGDYSLLSLISRQMKGFQKICDKYKSQRLMMQIILDGITIAELKTFLIMEFAIRKLAEVQEIDYKKELEQLKREILSRFKKLIANFQDFMKDASPEVWRCDPRIHVEDETYFRLNNLFTTYFARDFDVNFAEDCYYKCGDFVKALVTSCRERLEYTDIDTNYYEYTSCRSVRPCKGFLYDCWDKFVDYSELWTCPSPKGSTRRYEYISHGNINRLFKTRTLNRYGLDNGACKQNLTYDYRRYDEHLRVCEMCACTCDDSLASYSDKLINLRPATADKDYVITGIRWLKKDHTLNLQIEQGKLLAEGKVDPTTIHWKDVQEPRKRPADDTRKFDWEELRGFLLQDIKAPADSVVAGVKLEIVRNKDVRLLTLQLISVPYNYESGKLHYKEPFYDDPDGSLWTGVSWDPLVKLPDGFLKNETADLGLGKVPSNSKVRSIPIPDSQKYVLLTPSHFQSDVGQNTVPFFDMQENILSPPVPLSGLGIYLKRRDDFAGFLGLKLITFDNTNHLVERI